MGGMRPAQQVYVTHRAHECERFLASALSKRKRSRLVLVRRLCNLRTSKHRPVFAHVLVADVAPAAFSIIAGDVNFIIMGGPKMTTTALSGEGCCSFRTVGTNPTLPIQSSVLPPGSTANTVRTSLRSSHSVSSRLNTRSSTVRAPYTIRISSNSSRRSSTRYWKPRY